MKYWKTKKGEKLLIRDMETSHIENCIQMLEKKIKEGRTMVIHAGGHDADDMYYDEEDITEEIEEQILNFKIEILWRERKL